LSLSLFWRFMSKALTPLERCAICLVHSLIVEGNSGMSAVKLRATPIIFRKIKSSGKRSLRSLPSDISHALALERFGPRVTERIICNIRNNEGKIAFTFVTLSQILTEAADSPRV